MKRWLSFLLVFALTFQHFNPTFATQTAQDFDPNNNNALRAVPSLIPPWTNPQIHKEYEIALNSIIAPDKQDNFVKALGSFKQLRTTHDKLKAMPLGKPQCFISYAWGNTDQEYFVHLLAHHLDAAGINILLDLKHNTIGTGITQFAEKILDDTTDFVVLCGSKKLIEKYISTSYSVVKLELGMIAQRATGPIHTILPILLEGSHKEVLPKFLWNTVSKDFQKKEDYCTNCFSLLKNLYKLMHDDPSLEQIMREFTAPIQAQSSKKLTQDDIFDALKRVKVETLSSNDFATLVKSDLSLTKINLSGALNATQVNALSEAIKENHILEHLSLDTTEIDVSKAQVIATALKTNTTLTYLSLTRNIISDDGAIALAEALQTNSPLTTLWLYTNSIALKGIKALAKALEINSKLTLLGLEENNTNNEGAAALADALRINTTLRELVLSHNNIGNGGAIALAESLKKNTTITKLYLYNHIKSDKYSNYIGDEGAKAFAETLMHHKSLVYINLSNNKIGEEGKKALEELKRSRPSLELIY